MEPPPTEEIPLNEGPPVDPEPEEYEQEAPQQLARDEDDAASTSISNTNGSNGATVEMIKTVPWMRQLSTILWYKNLPLLQRKPVHLFLMIFSSVASALLSWVGGKDYKDDVVKNWPPLTDCGTIEPDYFEGLDYEEREKVPLTLNDSWNGGLPEAILSLGPMIFAICAFLLVHSELEVGGCWWRAKFVGTCAACAMIYNSQELARVQQ